MNSHFQSSDTTWTSSGAAFDASGFAGSNSYELIHATPPSSMIVNSGMAQTISSSWPEYSQSGRWRAFVLDERYHQAQPSVAAIVGTTMASMIASESIRMVFSASPTGPSGSSTAGLQPARTTEASRMPPRAARAIQSLRVPHRPAVADPPWMQLKSHLPG